MATFHESNYGRWANYFDADLDGFVYTSATEALAGRWDDALSDAMAADIAQANVRGLDRAEQNLAIFRHTGDYL